MKNNLYNSIILSVLSMASDQGTILEWETCVMICSRKAFGVIRIVRLRNRYYKNHKNKSIYRIYTETEIRIVWSSDENEIWPTAPCLPIRIIYLAFKQTSMLIDVINQWYYISQDSIPGLREETMSYLAFVRKLKHITTFTGRQWLEDSVAFSPPMGGRTGNFQYSTQTLGNCKHQQQNGMQNLTPATVKCVLWLIVGWLLISYAWKHT